MSIKTIDLLVASTNAKKLAELKDLLRALPFRLLGLLDLPSYREVAEDGKTFEENAILKAKGYAQQSGFLTLAEDSGLCCEALDGAPGVLSARFAGMDKNDQANNQKVLELLREAPEKSRSAQFESHIAIAHPGRLLGSVQGEVAGRIHPEIRGQNGFGYDPIFFYPPYGKTFGEISPAMKHKVSHRAKALTKAKKILENYSKDQTRIH